MRQVIRMILVEEGLLFSANEEAIWVTKSKDPNESLDRVVNRCKKFGITLKTEGNKIIFSECTVDENIFNSFNWAEENPFLCPLWGTFKRTFPFDRLKAEHFKPAIELGLKREREQFDKIIYSKDVPTFINTIETDLDPDLCVEDVRGNILECALGILDHLCYSKSTPELIEINEWAVKSTSDLYAYMMYNIDAYNRTMEAIKNYENPTVEEKRIIDNVIRNFKFSGVSLSPEEQQILKEIREVTSLAKIKYRDNVMNEQEKPIITTTDPTVLAGIPEIDKARFAETAKRLGKEGWVITGTRNDIKAVLENAELRSLRHDVFLSIPNNLSGEFSNVENIKTIVNNRIKVSNMFGYSCVADRTLETRMVKNKENVESFLNNLRTNYLPKAKQEKEEIFEYIKSIEGEEFKPERWDIPFYRNKYVKEITQVDPEVLRQYLVYHIVLKGIFELASKLYRIRFSRAKCPVYAEDVDVFKVTDTITGKYLGMLYVDPYARVGKKPGAWCGSFSDQYISAWEGIHDHRPHVYIVANFSKSEDETISFDDLNTLLHEFGHALHNLLSECKYASQSGTSVDHDMVELPSQIMENFAYCENFLRTIAYDTTGKGLPIDIIKRLEHRHQLTSGFSCIRQLRFGILDMAWATLDKELDNLDKKGIVEFEREALKDVDEFNELEDFDSNIHSGVFNHIFTGGYCAGYYSYKWAEMLDADAFSVFKLKGNPINQEVAASFRENILSKGDTEDAMELYKRFRGGEPTLNAMMSRDGISV